MSPEDAERARVQRWYGIDRKGRKANTIGYYDFDIEGMGFGYHLTNIAAAIGLGNLDYIALPCHLAIDDEDVAYLTETIREGW